MRYLTKSRFKLAVECPTKLFYTGKDKLYRNLLAEDSFMQALAEGGFQVGKMATMRYPDGIEVTERDNAGALARTQALLHTHDDIVLFEPAIAHGPLLVRVDILVKQGHSLQLIEVKAKSYNSRDPEILGARGGITSGMRPYIQDVAFQKFVTQQAMPQASIQCFLMMPDKAVTATVNGLNQCFKIKRQDKSVEVTATPQAPELVQASSDLLALVPVDQYIDMVMAAPLDYPGGQGGPQDFLPQAAARWAQAYAADQPIAPVIHTGCAHCEFREPGGPVSGGLQSGYHQCLQQAAGLSVAQVEAGTVLDIWNFRGKDKLLDQGVRLMSQVHEEDLNVRSDGSGGLSNSERQWLQVGGLSAQDQARGFYFNADYFETKRTKWRWPYHLIDFETCTVALPFFKAMRPYESVAFQFSHHVMHEDGRIEHKTQALIAKPGEFPNLTFVRTLRDALGQDNGTIFRWAAHENTILRHIKDQLLSDRAAELLGLPPGLSADQGIADRDELIDFIDSVVSYKVGDDTIAGPRAMVDLNDMARRAYFHPSTKGRTSIKKVLPAVLASSALLQAKYSQPIYGVQIPSLNFQQGFAWVQALPEGGLRDPYERLKTLAADMLGQQPAPDDVEVAEGGAAAMAYARLQFEDITPEQREQIEQALLRYCELDTFAMVMILEAWLEWGRG